ncbi:MULTISPECIES: short chain dehydrogenase [unclassified Cupriavidus]|uniref:short chain dehydrogenase n=1 Tax=unclassified Cupriavidus TaxID=2640874 RepID=UPI00049114E5|nr:MULTISPECIES: short chain dehydrogenase [unclassified Cupriavidus]MBP0630357.1 short chain dehydrogenase [Cupriavidus sp. AcVe19-1a]MBP0638688.1 short chain dehydrogenase [Cupriavidus sp. AcVe19-6a]
MRVLVIGATGLLGKEITALLSEEHDVIGASRSTSALSVDISDKESILAMYKKLGTVDAVVCVGGTAKFAPLDALTDDDFSFSLANKLMGQVNLVRYGIPYISQGGSVTLTSGTLAQHPMLGGAAMSTVNAGIEAFGRAAALEMQGKIRVNVVSPGWVWETLEAMGRDPAKGVRAAVVAQVYQKCILEDISGQVVSVTH